MGITAGYGDKPGRIYYQPYCKPCAALNQKLRREAKKSQQDITAED